MYTQVLIQTHTLMYSQVLHQMTVCIVQYMIDTKREKLSIDRTEGGGKGRGKRVGKKSELGVVVGMRELGMHRERKCQWQRERIA